MTQHIEQGWQNIIYFGGANFQLSQRKILIEFRVLAMKHFLYITFLSIITGDYFKKTLVNDLF